MEFWGAIEYWIFNFTESWQLFLWRSSKEAIQFIGYSFWLFAVEWKVLREIADEKTSYR